MTNATRQVHHSAQRDRALLNKMKADLEWTKHPFSEARQASRRYPAEGAGKFLAEYLNALPLPKRSVWLESLGLIQALAEAGKNHDVAAVHRLLTAKRGMKFAYEYLCYAKIPSVSFIRWQYST